MDPKSKLKSALAFINGANDSPRDKKKCTTIRMPSSITAIVDEIISLTGEGQNTVLLLAIRLGAKRIHDELL